MIQVSIGQLYIKGKVVDAISRQPLETVSVAEVGNQSSTTLSDQYGNFSLRTDKTRRQGVDLIARYQFTRNLFANFNINFTNPGQLVKQKDRILFPWHQR